MRVLVSWIGFTDLRSLAESLSPAERQLVLAKVPVGKAEKKGPVGTLVDLEEFDEIHLLSNFDSRINSLYVKWLGKKARLETVTLNQVTSYSEVFRATDDVLRKIKESYSAPFELCIHLSPGTPTMTAVLVLLGKSRYRATFFETHKGKVSKVDIPFDIGLDFVSEYLKGADSHLQHLVASPPSDIKGFEHIVGDSKAIRLAAGTALRAARREISVLILGESGTGKELFANAIHRASSRKDKPFLAVNCAAFPTELLDAELFGHEKGAFTGATSAKPGLFEQADGGTIFLDEIGECAPAMQVKLLRVLQPPKGNGPCHREFRRVGGEKIIKADVRVIAATNRDLMAAIQDNQFREDLYHRLAVITVKLPPLRERRGDIPDLVKQLLVEINDELKPGEPGYQDKTISASAMEFVKHHDWRGNVRQLRNTLIRAAVMTEGTRIERQHIVDSIAEMPTPSQNLLELPLGDGFNLEEHLNSIHATYLSRAMEEAGGVKTKAARLLGMKNYQTLDAQLKRLRVKVVSKY